MTNKLKFILTWITVVLLLLPGLPAGLSWAVSDIVYVGGHQAMTLSEEEQREFLPEEPTVKSAVVVDPAGREIYAYNAREISKIASVTKTMTAIVASDYPQDEVLRVSALAAGIPGSSAYLMDGDQVRLGELMEGLMLPSGNDAAYAIAEGIGRKMLEASGGDSSAPSEACVAKFIEAMNETAVRLGMSDTLFVNPCGLDDEGFEGDHHSTASDVAKMTAEAMRRPLVRDVVAKATENMDVHRADQDIAIPQKNTNRLLENNPECLGVKTGFTDQAGNCLASAFEIDGDIYTIVVLGADDSQIAFDETEKLWQWAKRTLKNYDLLGGWERSGEHPYLGQIADVSWTDKTVAVGLADASLPYTGYGWDPLPLSHISVTEINGGVEPGQVVGEVSYEDAAGNVIAKTAVITLEGLEEPTWWESICIWFTRLIAPITGDQTVAESHCEAGRATEIGQHYRL